MRQVLGHDLHAVRHHEQPTVTQAFALLRSRAENAGVFVLLKGDLGSRHTALPVELFRGFAIADEVAPFVAINDNDSTPAWSFTLLHEMVHLLLGQTGISGARSGTEVEEFCNNVRRRANRRAVPTITSCAATGSGKRCSGSPGA